MQKSDKYVNLLLVALVTVLLAICVATIWRQTRLATVPQQSEYGGKE
jgi:hypothetical protein